MGNPKLSKTQLVDAMRGLSDVERASIYAASIPKPEPITLDDLKGMTPQQIVAAHNAGQLDHLPAEQAARNEARRDERAERSRFIAQQEELRRQGKRAEATRLSID